MRSFTSISTNTVKLPHVITTSGQPYKVFFKALRLKPFQSFQSSFYRNALTLEKNKDFPLYNPA